MAYTSCLLKGSCFLLTSFDWTWRFGIKAFNQTIKAASQIDRARLSQKPSWNNKTSTDFFIVIMIAFVYQSSLCKNMVCCTILLVESLSEIWEVYYEKRHALEVFGIRWGKKVFPGSLKHRYHGNWTGYFFHVPDL